jgi:hypothetical protein
MQGGRADADGRLDLDELGEVIDHAATLGTEARDDGHELRAEVLDDGRGTSWAERLEDAGVTAWLRRHRVLVGSVAVTALLVGAGTVAARTLVPPPVDPELRITVTPVAPAQYIIGGAIETWGVPGIFPTGTTLRSAYALTAQDDGDTSTYAITGVTGPGVRASSASPQPDLVRGTDAARQDVDVIPDCFDPSVLTTSLDAYQLLVRRTDDRGRVLEAALPVPDAVTNWGALITATCLQTQAQFGLTPQSVTVRPDVDADVVAVDVVVSSTLAWPTVVRVEDLYGSPAIVPGMTPVRLPALRGAVLPVSLELRDCAAPSLSSIGVASFPGDQGYDGAARGLYLSVQFPDEVAGVPEQPIGWRGVAQAPLEFTPSQTRTIDAALASLCRDAEPAAVEVRDVGFAREVSGVFPNGNPVSTRFPVTLDVAVAGATRVALATPPVSRDESPTTLVGATAAQVDDGRASMRTWVDVDCGTGYAPPPTVQLTVTTARGDYPLLVTVSDAVLAESIAVNCPTISRELLLDFGWQPSV